VPSTRSTPPLPNGGYRSMRFKYAAAALIAAATATWSAAAPAARPVEHPPATALGRCAQRPLPRGQLGCVRGLRLRARRPLRHRLRRADPGDGCGHALRVAPLPRSLRFGPRGRRATTGTTTT
jgi:hypothetical protein